MTAPWGLQTGIPAVGFLCYWCAPGTRSHLHVTGATGSGKMYQVYIEPNLWKLWGGEVGLEKTYIIKNI